MIPSLVAWEIKHALRDFVATHFQPSNTEFSDVIDDFLADETSLIKGPYLSLALPYQRDQGDEPFPALPLGFTPYRHQRNAFDRLSRGLSTVVATGTGSGKTEAFLFPILDWCRSHSNEPGIKAILIYPMNALASDQAGRIARIVHSTDSLRGKVVAGIFVGQEGPSRHDKMTATRIISNRRTLVEHPPDILLTNYKMLDYLLSRPRDQRLWRYNEPERLRWLVVDELHTFDGAQGTDLACLIRRLKVRLRTADNLVCIGTSATLGIDSRETASPPAVEREGLLFPSPLFEESLEASKSEGGANLIDYVTEVFGTTFQPGSIVREERLSSEEFLGRALLTHHLVPSSDPGNLLDWSRFGSVEECVRAQYEFFFGVDPGPAFFTDDWKQALALRLKSHSAFVNLIRTLEGRAQPLQSIVERFRETLARCSDAEIIGILQGLCALISVARVREGDGPDASLRPFLQVSVHVWVRELGRMVCSVAEGPSHEDGQRDAAELAAGSDRTIDSGPTLEEPAEFRVSIGEAPHVVTKAPPNLFRRLRFSDDLGSQEPTIHLPLVQCNECRVTGWGALLNSGYDRVQHDLRLFYNTFFARDKAVRFLFPREAYLASDAPFGSVCGSCGYFRIGPSKSLCSSCGSDRVVEVLVPKCATEKRIKHGNDWQTVEELSTNCPFCTAKNSMFIFGARSSVLLGVVLSQLFASHYNDDRKAIAFSDNVQDAAHRAGFLAHRTWRNSKRAAIAQAISESSGIMLSDLPSRVVTKWSNKRQSANAFSGERFVEEFIPPDRTWRRSFEEFLETGRLTHESELPRIVEQRLQWEALAEAGFGAANANSLERSRTVSAGPCITGLLAATSSAVERIREESESLRQIGADRVVWMALGILRRLKDRGAIWSNNVDSIRGYLESGCSRWNLSHNRALPEFGPGVPRPVFPSDGYSSGKADGIEPLATSGGSSWYQRWIGRVLQLEPILYQSDELTAILRILLDSLKSSGLVVLGNANGVSVWAINPQRYSATSDLAVLSSKTAVRGLVVPSREAPHWIGAPCLEVGVNDTYQRVEQANPTWAGRMYLESEIHRVVAKDHTALLTNTKREYLERRFAAEQSRPFDPNVLSATPTLELGIDIGNLSTVALCSVPPSQSSYLQRIGRAGRRDGNALTVTLAAAENHDLYFYSDPLSMLGGNIDPPGVFLNASAVLERQLTSFCLDRWAEVCGNPDAIPGRVRYVLDAVEARDEVKFPYTFFSYTETHGDFLLGRFVEAFGGSLTEDSKDYLDTFLKGEQGQTPALRFRILGRLKQVVKELNSIGREIKRIADSIREAKKRPLDDATRDEIEQQERERKGLAKLRRTIHSRETFQFLTDEGLIPNYAFPEEGVTLRSVVLQRRTGEEVSQAASEKHRSEAEFDTYEYVRPSVAALSEFAPGNRFYAEGHKVEIDRVDLDLSSIEQWRLCPSCSHCRCIDAKDEFTACPRCGDPMWADSGQACQMLPLRLVYATTQARYAQIMDDRDDRESAFFTRHLVSDPDPTATRKGYAIRPPGFPFAFEYVSRTTFREMNFGKRTTKGRPTRFAGEELPRMGFRICKFCGKVQSSRPGGPEEHTLNCKKGDRRAYATVSQGTDLAKRDWQQTLDSAIIDCLYLYRTFQSESLRMLVPVMEASDSDPYVHSFIAAVELGLRAKFRGKIDHLRMMASSDISHERGTRQTYLVLYDTVPGGTGYLKQLSSGPTKIVDVFKTARDHLAECDCDDGCYRCVFAYRRRYEMERTSKRVAIDVLNRILADVDALEPVDDIGKIDVHGISESELEVRFLRAFEKRAASCKEISIRPDIVRGKSGHFIKAGSEAWYVEPQADLGLADGVIRPSRPDFLLHPAKATNRKRSVAVFLDGFQYHREKTAEDCIKRMALVRGGFLQWSLTWHDLDVAFGGSADALDLLRVGSTGSNRTNPMKILQDRLDAMWSTGPMRSRLCESSFDLLVEYLADPDLERWKQAVFTELFSAFDQNRMQDPVFQAELRSVMDSVLPPVVSDAALAIDTPRFVAGLGSNLGTESNLAELFLALPGTAVTNPQPDAMFVALHLCDSDPDVDDYRRTWNGVLRLFNLIQFLPTASWSTSEAVAKGDYPDTLVPTDAIGSISQGWSEAIDLADHLVRDFLVGLARMDLHVPEIGYELIGTQGTVVADAEVAWPDEQIAIQIRDEPDNANAFKRAGWQVLCSKLDADMVVAALRDGSREEG